MPTPSWEQLIWQIPVGVAAIAVSVAILFKVMTSAYGQIINAQSTTIRALGKQNEQQAEQIGTLQEQVIELRRQITDDRRNCQQEIEAVKAELMMKIHQCPVLTGEAPPGQCPMLIPERQGEPIPVDRPTEPKEL